MSEETQTIAATDHSFLVEIICDELNIRQKADFINCVAWNKTAETVAKYVSKGNLIGIEGRLQVRSYENRSPALSSKALSRPQLVRNRTGCRQYITEVLVNRLTFLESKKVVPSLNH